jgi:putative hemolysin
VPDPISASRAEAHFCLRIADTEQDLRAAQRLRYRVFVQELGGAGTMVDHAAELECDRFDPYFDHLVLIDTRRNAAELDHVVGVYRLLPGDRAAAAGGFYSAEYDLTLLQSRGDRVLELGRSCVHADYRGGTAMLHLWNGLADYVLTREIELLFGVASFHGTDIAALRQPLSWLHHNYLAPAALRVHAKLPNAQRMDLIASEFLDRPAALRAIPALIRAYLRLGGFVGEGAFIDHAFNTTDVCLIMDTKAMSEKHRGFYTRNAARVGAL